jgi:hypothetical protein
MLGFGEGLAADLGVSIRLKSRDAYFLASIRILLKFKNLII